MAIVFASATRTQAVGTYNSDMSGREDVDGTLFHLNISAIGTTPTLDIKFQTFDALAGAYRDLKDSAGNTVAFAQKTGTGQDTLTIGAMGVEKLTGSDRRYAQPLPLNYRVVATVGDAGGDTITFSLSTVALGQSR